MLDKIPTVKELLYKKRFKKISAIIISKFTNLNEDEALGYLKSRKAKKIDEYKKNISGEYNHSPQLSFLIQFFNSKENIRHIVDSLPEENKYETIVLEDGSVDGSLQTWRSYLNRRSDFLIRSNDLHEIRAYTRGVDYSQAKYVCLLQDDDEYPSTHRWITRGIELLESSPDLAALGGLTPSRLGYEDCEYGKLSYSGKIPPLSDWHWGDFPNEQIFPRYNEEYINVVEPNSQIPLIFVPGLIVGPIIVDKKALKDIGGFDFEFSQPGEPGVQFDKDFTTRLWKNGYKVGYSNMGFFGQNTEAKTRIYQSNLRRERNEKNKKLYKQKHSGDYENIEELVCEANQHLVSIETSNARPLIETNE